MSDTEIKKGIEKLFREALQALAAEPDDQVKVTTPGDVPVEIIEDFLQWSESYQNYFCKELEPNTVKEIGDLANLVESLTESVFKDTNLESMLQPEWQPLREKAKLLLLKLNWPIEPPPPFIDEGGGVYRRV